MVHQIKSIGFFVCSNGYGHYKRISEIASLLSNDFDITIYATWSQMYNLGGVKNCRHIQQHVHNIRWDKTLNDSKVDYKVYKECLEEHKEDLKRHTYVVSDNIIGILDYRPDAIIIGSFLWKDVLFNKFGDNRISDIDRTLLREYKPPIITNKYAETGTLKEYGNKLQFGFGCESKPYRQFEIEELIPLKPSLNYLDSYSDFLKNINVKSTEDFSKTSKVALMCRPGLGIITHCVEHYIPLIALYDENDSSEILELADRVVTLNIGFKQNVNKEFKYNDYSLLKDNSIYKYNHLEKDGYKKIAAYLKAKL